MQSLGWFSMASPPVLDRPPPLRGSAWDIYAAQMCHHGHGYPLWYPDPNPGAREVELGDVGWISQGAMITLFNTLRGAGDAQPYGDVPVDHVVLDAAQSKMACRGPKKTITSPMLFGRGLQMINDGSWARTSDRWG